MDVDAALDELLRAMRHEHELQLRALLHVAFMRFDAACEKTRQIVVTAKNVKALQSDRDTAIASLGVLVQQLVRDAPADSEGGKGDRKAKVTTSASSDAVIAASKTLLAALSGHSTVVSATPATAVLSNPVAALPSAVPATVASPVASVVSGTGAPAPQSQQISLEDFEFLQPIAEGGAGKVYLARLIRTGAVFASGFRSCQFSMLRSLY